jgi:hypothetical protein
MQANEETAHGILGEARGSNTPSCASSPSSDMPLLEGDSDSEGNARKSMQELIMRSV